MRAGVRTKEKRKSELYQGAMRKRTRKRSNINYKQNGVRVVVEQASTDRRRKRKGKKRCLYRFEAL